MQNKFSLISISLSLLAFASCNSSEENGLNGGTRSSALAVDYVVIQPQPLVHNLQLTGSLIPSESAELSTQAAGKVQAILFEEGDLVKKGQTLLRIDDREWQAQLQRYKAELENAKKDLERKQALSQVEGITDSELEAAELRVQTLEANIEETRVRLNHASISAPFDGRIGLRSVSPGSYVSAGASVAMLVQDDPVKLQFNVPERYASKLRPGQAVSFKVANRDTTYQAQVYATEPMISESTRALRVRARTKNPEGHLIPGSYADVTLRLDSVPNALMVPTEAVLPELNKQLVYRIKNGKAEKVMVKTGVRQPNKVQVTKGLDVGDTVMVSGLLQVRPGISVKADEEVNVESFDNN